MRMSETSKGTKVKDRWYPENGIGEVISIKGPEVRVKFASKVVKYDILNMSNLEKVDEEN